MAGLWRRRRVGARGAQPARQRGEMEPARRAGRCALDSGRPGRTPSWWCPTAVLASRRRNGGWCSSGSTARRRRVPCPVRGLGLAIVKQVVVKHGGTLRVEDTVPGGQPPGTSMHVVLPGPVHVQLDTLPSRMDAPDGQRRQCVIGGVRSRGEKSRECPESSLSGFSARHGHCERCAVVVTDDVGTYSKEEHRSVMTNHPRYFRRHHRSRVPGPAAIRSAVRRDTPVRSVPVRINSSRRRSSNTTGATRPSTRRSSSVRPTIRTAALPSRACQLRWHPENVPAQVL